MRDEDGPTQIDLATVQDDVETLQGPDEPGTSPSAPISLARRYLTRETIGVGGMGEVRLCTDLVIGRDVAMKVMRESKSGSSGLRARFEREARLQGQLEHPAIVPVYDLGGGFFTMKRVRGHTLEGILRGLLREDPAFASFTLRRLLVAFVQVTQAIAFAHARGVVHRDLKPGNIMLGDFGEVYVLDWGLAKVLGRSEVVVETEEDDMPTRVGSRTAHGALLGTPGYMPPEQARGDHDALDARADVYALGAILFEILTLEPLHRRGTLEEVIESTMFGTEARPTVRAPDAQPPPELDAVCVRATAVDARDRHGSARELAADVERFLDGERDSSMQKRLATAHNETAREAIARGDRAEAMKALSRALAIDPNEREALATMAELLLSPPGDPPPEALAELDQSRDDERKATARGGAVAFLSWLLVLPLLLFAGLADGTVWVGFALMLGVPALAAAWVARRKGPLTDRVGFGVLLATTSAIALSSAYLGPFIVVPAWAAQNTLVFAMHARAGWPRFGAIAIGTFAVIAPLALELTGVISPSFRFVGGKLELASRVVTLSPAPTLLLLFGITLALIAIPSLIVARAHDDATEAKKRLATHLWHLRKIVPGGA
ncbi:MAG: protein kinase [Myxococcales bacterium]|nr:protein kinase [Myxococcales bacterium]